MLVLFVIPFYRDTVDQFVAALADLAGVSVGLISQDPYESFPASVGSRVAGHWKVGDVMSVDSLEWAARELSKRHGRIHRVLAINEHVQIPAAELRQRLGVEGMDPETIRRFRDKGHMKDIFRAQGVPALGTWRLEMSRAPGSLSSESAFPFASSRSMAPHLKRPFGWMKPSS